MAKKDLLIYEGPMCCSTGICGPEPDKTLIEFNETLKKLQKEFKGLRITRANMSSNIGMFRENKDILQLVQANGLDVLPITTIDGRIVSKQRYLKYEELRKALSGD